MNSEKRVFSTLGGIFLMAASFFMFIITALNLVRSFSYLRYYGGSFASYAVSMNLEIAMLLCGLFLLLRKKLLAAIMMCVVAFFYLVTILSGSGITVWSACIFLAYGLCGAGLFGKGVYGLAMCGSAALLRFIPFARQLTFFRQNVSYGGISILTSSCSLLASMLAISGMVMAGLYLFSLREKASAQPGYRY